MKTQAVIGAAVVVVALVAACRDDGGTPGVTNDPRVSQISGLAELATYAYSATSGEGLLDYLAADLAENCTTEDITRALADQPVPTGFKMIKDVEFDGKDKARAMVVVTTAEGEEEQEWSFIREGDDSWRIVSMPSLSQGDCGG